MLVARSVDAGWIDTFARAAAVVVETGGDLSHGSILLRERGGDQRVGRDASDPDR